MEAPLQVAAAGGWYSMSPAACLLWILLTPWVLAALGTLTALALPVIRWINEHEEARLARALWAGLWLCGAAILAVGVAGLLKALPR